MDYRFIESFRTRALTCMYNYLFGTTDYGSLKKGDDYASLFRQELSDFLNSKGVSEGLNLQSLKNPLSDYFDAYSSTLQPGLTLKMLYDLLSEVEASEYISFRIMDITMEGFVNSAIRNEFDMEFPQYEFLNYLSIVLYRMLLNIGYFIIYVGKLNSSKKRLLLCGTMHDLTPREYMSENVIEQYPYHELMWENFKNYQKEWKDIWGVGMAFPLMLFYNHKVLIEYLESLKNSYTK